MELTHILLLVGSGLAAGFIAGLIGVGGGIIFAPVLFFYFRAVGTAPDLLAPLTIGSSLFCTIVAAVASTWFQYRRGSVVVGIAWRVGLFSAVSIFLVTRFVTTRPWYDASAFQVVFSILMATVIYRMLFGRGADETTTQSSPRAHSIPFLAGTGIASGTVAVLSGVGGGVILVPTYANLFRLPMHTAAGTSSATIILSSLIGVATYVAAGWGEPVPATAIGFVDVGHALLLAAPSVLTARFGVWTAHRVETTALRWSFAVIAGFVIIRMVYDAFIR